MTTKKGKSSPQPRVQFISVVQHNDTMEPTLKKGDHVSIDTTAKAIDRGGIYCFLVPNVARHAGDTRAYRIARVHALKDGYMIQPDNSKYPAEFVPAAEFGDLFVIGKVVMLQRDLWQ